MLRFWEPVDISSSLNYLTHLKLHSAIQQLKYSGVPFSMLNAGLNWTFTGSTTGLRDVRFARTAPSWIAFTAQKFYALSENHPELVLGRFGPGAQLSTQKIIFFVPPFLFCKFVCLRLVKSNGVPIILGLCHPAVRLYSQK